MTIKQWIIHNVFKQYNNGSYIDIVNNHMGPPSIRYKSFIKRGWNCYLNLIPHINNPNPLSRKTYPTSLTLLNYNLISGAILEQMLSRICSSSINRLYYFTHCLVGHTSSVYYLLEQINLHKYRFGVIIMKVSQVKDIKKDRYRIRTLLGKHYYHFYGNIDSYDCYVCNIGYPPYYLGQTILDKYVITGNFKSGCGSSGVYMARDINDTDPTDMDYNATRFVVKRSNSKKTFIRELNALIRTTNWIHSPTIIDYNAMERIIITNWCGKDLKLLDSTSKNTYSHKIQLLIDELYNKYQLYHNDVRWKNITIIGSNLILIDWGMTDIINKERDPETILRDDQRKNSNIPHIYDVPLIKN